MSPQEMQARILELERRLRKLEQASAAPPADAPATSKQKTASLKTLLENDCREANAVDIPLLLNTQPFLEAWKAYAARRTTWATVGHPSGGKKPWTRAAAVRILRICEKLGEAPAIAALEMATEKGWLDLYPQNTPPPSNHGRPPTNQRSSTGGTNAGRYGKK